MVRGVCGVTSEQPTFTFISSASSHFITVLVHQNVNPPNCSCGAGDEVSATPQLPAAPSSESDERERIKALFLSDG